MGKQAQEILSQDENSRDSEGPQLFYAEYYLFARPTQASLGMATPPIAAASGSFMMEHASSPAALCEALLLLAACQYILILQ
ncbi:hypothetical protein APTSU1_000635500 [Apodemus speciosus]|uniref:Uncharacterized protein n=1 Tax=Apodemus speciosus TaxID=105296 RepID=A0ABQ0EW63_APOSI